MSKVSFKESHRDSLERESAGGTFANGAAERCEG